MLYDKLMDQTKLQTIRTNWVRWWKWASKGDIIIADMEHRRLLIAPESRPLQIYWGNPRNGGAKMGTGSLIGLQVKGPYDLTEEDAERDGFENLEELDRALNDTNGPLDYSTPLAILTFGWRDGPHNVRGVRA